MGADVIIRNSTLHGTDMLRSSTKIDNRENIGIMGRIWLRCRNNKSYKVKSPQTSKIDCTWYNSQHQEHNKMIVILSLRHEKVDNGVEYPVFITELKNHVLCHFNEPADIIPAIDEFEDPKIALIQNQPLPTTTLAQNIKLLSHRRLAKEEEIMCHINRITTLDDNMTKLYELIWKQCSTG